MKQRALAKTLIHLVGAVQLILSHQAILVALYSLECTGLGVCKVAIFALRKSMLQCTKMTIASLMKWLYSIKSCGVFSGESFPFGYSILVSSSWYDCIALPHQCNEKAEGDQFHKANPNEIMPGPREMPSPQNEDYQYNASRDPPILSAVFNANFYGCNKSCIKSQLDLFCLFH